MRTKIVIWFYLALFISSCGMPGPLVPTSTPRPLPTQIPPTEKIQPTQFSSPGCVSPEPTQDDIDRALSFTGKMFDTADWKRSYNVAETRVSVTWLSDSLGSVAYLEALIFSCGYEEIDIDDYFTDDDWDIIFENYESYEITDECINEDGLRLYEFEADSLGSDYFIRYWAKPDSDHRLITMMMTFPFQNIGALNDYAYRLFPTLTTCK